MFTHKSGEEVVRWHYDTSPKTIIKQLIIALKKEAHVDSDRDFTNPLTLISIENAERYLRECEDE
jgi:hypothetical protein